MSSSNCGSAGLNQILVEVLSKTLNYTVPINSFTADTIPPDYSLLLPIK